MGLNSKHQNDANGDTTSEVMYRVGEVTYTSSMLARRSSQNHLRQTITFVVIDVTCTAFVRLQTSQRRKKYRHSRRENLTTQRLPSPCAHGNVLCHTWLSPRRRLPTTPHPVPCALRLVRIGEIVSVVITEKRSPRWMGDH